VPGGFPENAGARYAAPHLLSTTALGAHGKDEVYIPHTGCPLLDAPRFRVHHGEQMRAPPTEEQ